MSDIKDVQIHVAPNLRISTSEHFHESCLKKQFDMSVLVPMYIYISKNLQKLKKHIDHEFSIGRSSVVYSINNTNNIHLITGWIGNRKKIELKKEGK